MIISTQINLRNVLPNYGSFILIYSDSVWCACYRFIQSVPFFHSLISPLLCLTHPASLSFPCQDSIKTSSHTFHRSFDVEFHFLKTNEKEAKALLKANIFSLSFSLCKYILYVRLHTLPCLYCRSRERGVLNVLYKCTKREIDKAFLI